MVGDIYVKGLGLSFPQQNGVHEVLRDVDFVIHSKEFLVLFGPGQCGKTVLMEAIAGLLPPTAGSVEDAQGSPLRTQELCMVFQKYALFPWKTCRQNIELPMKFKGVPKQARRKRAADLIHLVGLDGFERSYPRQLSGGMKQRVAIAAAYAKECPLLLFDEPFGALDAQTRLQMEQELVRIWQQEQKTVVLITNSIDEALLLGDRILVLAGSPSSILEEYDLREFPRPRSLSDRPLLNLRQSVLNRGFFENEGGGDLRCE